MTTAASRKTYLDPIMIRSCQGDDTFVAFQPMRIFRFWRNGKFTFFQRCLQPLYFSRSPRPTQLKLPFCAGVQFSRDYIRAFNDRIIINTRKYRALNSLHHVWLLGVIFISPLIIELDLESWEQNYTQFAGLTLIIIALEMLQSRHSSISNSVLQFVF